MNAREYPRILEILDDGTIIALDKNNRKRADLNIKTLTYEQQVEVFGGILIKDIEREKDNYDNPNRYYNERDYRREKLLEEEVQKNKRSKKWLFFAFIIVLIIAVILTVKSCTNQNKENLNESQQTQQTSEQQPNQQDDVETIEQKDEQIQQSIKDTQDGSVAKLNL